MQLTYAEMSRILGLTLPTDLPRKVLETVATSAVTDSREVTPSSLFVCLVGERVDGHKFVPEAVSAGASIILAEKPLADCPVPVLQVPNSLKALGTLAHAWRKRTRAKVIAVTGTCGKTTVKETLKAVLAEHGVTAVSRRNNNTQVGMPCSVLQTSGEEDFWVMELGISTPKDMDELGSILEPDVAIILNVGDGHTEGLGDLGVAHYKTRLLLHLAKDGEAVVSADYPELVWKALGTHIPKITFFSAKAGVALEGEMNNAGVHVRWLFDDANGHGHYELTIPNAQANEQFQVEAPFGGSYGAENCAAVAAAAKVLGLSREEVRQGLTKVVLPPQRFCRIYKGPWEIIDDTYNANPLSMERMLLAAKSANQPLLLILGEMRELGSGSGRHHQALGNLIATLAPIGLFWHGGYAENVKTGLAASGYKGPFYIFNDQTSFDAALETFAKEEAEAIKAGGVALFKGSRANHLEDYLSYFVTKLGALDVL